MSKHLIHTGYAKSGSTFLQSWFELNPTFCYSEQRFGGFSDCPEMTEKLSVLDKIDFSYYVTSSECLGAGVKVPYKCVLYSFTMMKDVDSRPVQKNICKVLSESYPTAKILIITRGYKSILKSLYSEYVKSSGKLNFRNFLQEYTPLLTRWLDYDFNIEIYIKEFGEENVIVLPFELLKESSTNFVELIEDRLDLPHGGYLPGVENPSLGLDKLYWYSRLSRFIISPFASLLSEKNAGILFNLYGYKFVSQDRLGWFLNIINKVFNKSEKIEFPSDYFEAYKGRASYLKTIGLYKSFKKEYFLD